MPATGRTWPVLRPSVVQQRRGPGQLQLPAGLPDARQRQPQLSAQRLLERQASFVLRSVALSPSSLDPPTRLALTHCLVLCTAVDCKQPPPVENGRVIVVNGTTTYGGAAEYHCLPHHQRIGLFLRKCLDSGLWSGEEPRCEGDDLSVLYLEKFVWDK